MLGEVLYEFISCLASSLPHQLCRVADISLPQLVFLLELLAELQRKIPTLGCSWTIFVVHEDVAAVLAEVLDDSLAVFP